jgi:hypothetical protein
MKILKHGIKPKPITINAVFCCYNCGCEWLANIMSECVKANDRYYGFLTYGCDCPECGRGNVTVQTTNKQE